MAVGQSDDVDPAVAIAEAIQQCMESLGTESPTAALLFSTADAFAPASVRAIRDAFPGVDVVGATSSAEISSAKGYMEDSVALAVFASDEVEIGTGVADGLGSDVESTCRRAVQSALDGVNGEPKLCIVLHESFVADPPEIVRALTRILPETTVILGGTSARSDFTTVSPTYQFCNDTVASDGVAVMIFAGPLRLSYAIGAGFRTIGPKGTVTRADAWSVQEIDGRPATEFLFRYIDTTGPGAYANPLAVSETDGRDSYFRAIRPSEPGTGALVTAGSVPIGAAVQVTSADTDEILTGTRAALERALATYPAGAHPDAALIFSCAVRKFFLGTRTRVEAELARDVLGDVPTAGMYCYGEIGPIEGHAGSRFLNETFVAILLGA